jgi:hypothetical protein
MPYEMNTHRGPIFLALAASFVLTVLIIIGSRNLEHYDAALFGYTVASVNYHRASEPELLCLSQLDSGSYGREKASNLGANKPLWLDVVARWHSETQSLPPQRTARSVRSALISHVLFTLIQNISALSAPVTKAPSMLLPEVYCMVRRQDLSMRFVST